MRISDWSSDVCSSDLENELMGHPKIAEAAVIGVPHPKWAERPLACVVVAPGEELTKDEVLEFLDGRVAKWWLRDDVAFVRSEERRVGQECVGQRRSRGSPLT